MNKLVTEYVTLTDLTKENKAILLAFIEVETGGEGFDSKTGKILIQFEPSWFKKKAPYAPSGKWSLNKVERQDKEWIAFNDAFYKNANAAMESTSIGLGQIMGFNYKMLGFKTVGEMWDDAKKGIPNQVEQIIAFINAYPALKKALVAHNWSLAAKYYNGPSYLAIAKKYNRTPYNISLSIAYAKWIKLV